MGITISRPALIVAASLAGWACAGSAWAETITVPLTSAQCVPAFQSTATGTANLTYDPATRKVTWDITFGDLSSPPTMAHFHGPAQPGKNAKVIIWLTKQGVRPHNPITGEATLTPELARQFTAGEWYVNVHSQEHPACVLRGQVPPPKT
jgi:hypothetical protein